MGPEAGKIESDRLKATTAHLNMIQAVIARMGGNCFNLKVITVTLTAALLAFSGKNPSPLVVLAALVPVVVFWGLDAQYLRLERLFRRLHDGVRRGKVTCFDMNFKHYECQEDSVFRIAFTWSVGWFYATVLVVLIAVGVYLWKSQDAATEGPTAGVSIHKYTTAV